jgi:ubiquinone/menaquinone biosynthesis C-methylase UbiE
MDSAVTALNDPALVAREYADETGLSARIAALQNAGGTDPWDVAFDAVAEAAAQSVLEVGPGRGEFAERMQRELGVRVTAVDQSERMVELTSAWGIDTIVGDVQDLPLPDATFDCAVAAWMLFHVPDLDQGLRELRRVLRPGGRLVAVTNSATTLPELWGLFPNAPARSYPFSAENGEEVLRRHFETVDRRDVHGTVTFEDHAAAKRYVAASPRYAHLAEDLPQFDGPLVTTKHVAVFVTKKGA